MASGGDDLPYIIGLSNPFDPDAAPDHHHHHQLLQRQQQQQQPLQSFHPNPFSIPQSGADLGTNNPTATTSSIGTQILGGHLAPASAGFTATSQPPLHPEASGTTAPRNLSRSAAAGGGRGRNKDTSSNPYDDEQFNNALGNNFGDVEDDDEDDDEVDDAADDDGGEGNSSDVGLKGTTAADSSTGPQGPASSVGRKRNAPSTVSADDKKARDRKRILRNRELARVSNERRKGRIKAMEQELEDTRVTVKNLEESIQTLEAENQELRKLLESRS